MKEPRQTIIIRHEGGKYLTSGFILSSRIQDAATHYESQFEAVCNAARREGHRGEFEIVRLNDGKAPVEWNTGLRSIMLGTQDSETGEIRRMDGVRVIVRLAIVPADPGRLAEFTDSGKWYFSKEDRIQALENEGCTRSDAQAVVEAEDLKAVPPKP